MSKGTERFNEGFTRRILRAGRQMMNKGIDGTASCLHFAAQIKAAGYSFVCRYYSHSPWKNLTKVEALAISQAGLYIVSVWETNPTYDGYFDHAQGVKDGQAAYAFAQGVGQPEGTPIYFAVDYDAAPSAVSGVITDYFRGVHETLQSANYPVGVYGSGLVCEKITAAGYAAYCWLANADGWRGEMTFAHWNIRQAHSVTIDGLSFDLDLTRGSGGGWQVTT